MDYAKPIQYTQYQGDIMLILSECEKNELRKTVCFATKAALENHKKFKKVTNTLEQYNIYLFDTIDEPEQFKIALELSCPKKYFDIIDEIEKNLEDYSGLEPIRDFVENLEEPTFSTIDARVF